jgi:hypothetical protein
MTTSTTRGRPRARLVLVAAAVIVAAAVVVTTAIAWSRGGETVPVVSESTGVPTSTTSDPATPTTSGPSPTPTLVAGLPLLPRTQDPLIVGRELSEQAGGNRFSLRECGLPRGQSGGAPHPADALQSRKWVAGTSESFVYEDVVVMPDADSADRGLDSVRAYYAGCFPPEEGQLEQVTRTTEVEDLGDEAFMVVVDVPDEEVPLSSTAVVVRQGPTLAMYMLFAPGLGPQTYEDSALTGLVEEFLAVAPPS